MQSNLELPRQFYHFKKENQQVIFSLWICQVSIQFDGGKKGILNVLR